MSMNQAEEGKNATEEILIECKGVCLSYRKREILRGADLRVPAGKITVLLGKNGSGKTTLLRCICGIRRITAGEIYLSRDPLIHLSPRERARRVALMPQNLPSLHRSVAELVEMGRSPYLSFGGRLGDGDRAAIERAVEKTDTRSHLKDAVCTLSGGERQLAFFAMALAQNTRAVMLDEPTANLDTEYRRKVFQTLRTLRQEGCGLLVTLHNMEEAVSVADRIAVLDSGKMIFEGETEEFLYSGISERAFGLRPIFAQTETGERFTVFRSAEE